jgi:hemolysin III
VGRISGTSKRSELIEEVFNSVTHGIGAVLAIAGLVVLIVFSRQTSLLSCIVYGTTLVLLYLASTLYHSLSFTRARDFFRKMDHMAIYLLIAGTYTPFCLLALKGTVSWILLGAVWTFAIVGVVMKVFFTGRYEWISITMYVLMGWMVVPVMDSVYRVLSLQGFLFLLAGGAAYTVGVIFYLSRRIPFSHSIWHLWVLAGSILHFFSVLTLI